MIDLDKLRKEFDSWPQVIELIEEVERLQERVKNDKTHIKGQDRWLRVKDAVARDYCNEITSLKETVADLKNENYEG